MARTILGASPLGISFFGEPQEQNSLNYLKPHRSFSYAEAKAILDGGKVSIKFGKYTSVKAGGTASTATGSLKEDTLTIDNGLGFRTFGDKKSIFTNKEELPRTFHVFGERDTQSEADKKDISMVDFIKSEPNVYYNSNYLDQYSTIPQIIAELKPNSSSEGAQERNDKSIKLEYADFAYLKKLGVYPANRLVIARKFDTGVGDNLLTYQGQPISLIPSWIPDGKNFVDITYSEEWEDHDTTTLTGQGEKGSAGKMFEQYGYGSNEVNNQLKSAGNIFALPGFTEYLQYKLFDEQQFTDPANLLLLPQGNPNIIRKAQKRKTYGEDRSFSGLKYGFSVDISTEYEIKYIDGIDPTLIYFDIISNLLSFGTSDSQFQFNGGLNKALKKTIDDLSSGSYTQVMQAIGRFIDGFLEVSDSVLKDLAHWLFGKADGTKSQTNITQAFLSSQVKKYRLNFLATINALTGSPSGIYHVTIGNPLRPIFESGDLLPAENSFKITLGPELGYNNLPTTIKFEGKLKNARPCGLQEIYRKFSPKPIRKSKGENIAQPTDIEKELIIRSSQIIRTRTKE